jgi:hypothetical protein
MDMSAQLKIKKNSHNKLNSILNRVIRTNSCAIIFNIPSANQSMLVNRLNDEKKHIAVNGRNASSSMMLLNRLSSLMKHPKLKYDMMPAVLNGKILTIFNADFIDSTFSRVFEACSQNKVPLLLLFNTDMPIERVRTMPGYQRVLTIEQDYKDFMIH